MTMSVAMVGAGRVGRSLGRSLHKLGWHVDSVTTRSASTARAAVRAIGAGHPEGRLTPRVLASEVVLIAVPDSAIEGVATDLAAMGGSEWDRKVALHTSGALDSTVLQPLAKLGASIGSIHIMQTFSAQSPPALDGCLCGIEGKHEAVKIARKICRLVGGVVVPLNGKDKAAYHAAGVFACGHVLALVEAATRLLMAQGLTRRQSVRALLPLTRQTLDNVERVGPNASWTGPLARNDFQTIESHARALADFPPEYLVAYNAVSRLTARLLSADPEALQQRLDEAISAAPGNRKSGIKAGQKLEVDLPE
jgi:predicted short-subunit dehydrogenase-like oxidoreductase (DUF2520 family)